MRILVTADLHYRPADRGQFTAFAEHLAAQQPDCLVLAGDLGHPLRLFRRALQLFADLSCPRLVLAGNHDLYHGEHDSRTLWQQALPEATRAEGCIWLEDEIVRLGDVAVIGTMAWYDYSAYAGPEPLTPAALRAAKHLVNHDADYINWPWSDVAVARYLAKGFARRLQAAVATPRCSALWLSLTFPFSPPRCPTAPMCPCGRCCAPIWATSRWVSWFRPPPR